MDHQDKPTNAVLPTDQINHGGNFSHLRGISPRLNVTQNLKVLSISGFKTGSAALPFTSPALKWVFWTAEAPVPVEHGVLMLLS